MTARLCLNCPLPHAHSALDAQRARIAPGPERNILGAVDLLQTLRGPMVLDIDAFKQNVDEQLKPELLKLREP